MLTRYRVLYIAALAVVFIFSITAFLPDALAKQNKAPSIEEASVAVSKLDPTIKVLSVNPTLMPDLWEVVVLPKTQQKTVLYLNSAGTLVFAGSLFDINNRINLTKARQDDLNRMAGYLGVMAQANIDEPADKAPPASDHKTAEIHGRHVAQVTAQYVAGREALPFQEEAAFTGGEGKPMGIRDLMG